MFRKHSWGNVSIYQGDRTKAQQTDNIPEDWLLWFFFYCLCSIPRIWPECTELCVSCGAESEQGPLLRSPVTWHAEFHNSTQREKAARWPFHLFHLALSWYPPLRCSLVIYAVAIGKTDITCSWQCATSKLSYWGDGSRFFTCIFLHCYFLPTIWKHLSKTIKTNYDHDILSIHYCHSSHYLKAAYTENFWNHHLKQNIII